MKQLTLFPQDPTTSDMHSEAPAEPLALLRSGATLVLSISGGKDSDAMSHYLLDLRASEGWTGEVVMLHADLGRAEWSQTPEYVRNFAQRKGVELHVVRHSYMDLIDRIWQRYHQDPTRPCWPSSKIRYCTSDFKTSIAARFLRNHFPTGNVICALGFRKSESPARKKRDAFSLRKDASAPTKGRFVYNWLPIHEWTEDDVWACIRQHGDIAHPAYHLPNANQRLSCALCVLASENDLLNGATHNPEVYREYCRIEAVTGYSFRQNFWLSDIRPELLDHETLTAIQRHKEAKR
jgi:3'-phosphoadenosine 5'-phosphosulfate sulfotransferase (PAPS reductase)/FAD synthetase